MRKTFTLVSVALLCGASAFAAGKGDSVAATNVFSGKLIETISEVTEDATSTFLYNEKSQLVSVRVGGLYTETITFDYTGGTYNGVDYDVKMEAVSQDETMDIYITVGDNLFASSAYQETTSSTGARETDTWRFEYNNDGQLVKMTRSEGDNEVTTLTYTDGDIVKVEVSDDYSNAEVSTISYGTAIENKSGFMLFDTTFCVDMDEMEIAYFAGLLGKTSKNYPESSKDSDGDVEKYIWTVDGNGYPTGLSVVDYDGDTDTMKFTWKESTGVEGAVMESIKQPVAYFTPQGVRVMNPGKGLYIIKNSDGTASKVLIK